MMLMALKMLYILMGLVAMKHKELAQFILMQEAKD